MRGSGDLVLRAAPPGDGRWSATGQGRRLRRRSAGGRSGSGATATEWGRRESSSAQGPQGTESFPETQASQAHGKDAAVLAAAAPGGQPGTRRARKGTRRHIRWSGPKTHAAGECCGCFHIRKKLSGLRELRRTAQVNRMSVLEPTRRETGMF